MVLWRGGGQGPPLVVYLGKFGSPFAMRCNSSLAKSEDVDGQGPLDGAERANGVRPHGRIRSKDPPPRGGTGGLARD